MVVGLLGILKAGGSYVPFDPTYPTERLAFMLADTQTPVLLTQQHLVDRLPKENVNLICLDTNWAQISQESQKAVVSNVKPDNLAYTIYTSGSTGRPKGVQIEHKSLLNLVNWHLAEFKVTAVDRATQVASLAFDACVWELWPYLSVGASIYISGEETRLSPEKLRDWLVSQGITISFLPTPLAERMLRLKWPADVALRTLLTGGDKLYRYPPTDLPFELVNNYGPTENTVVTTSGTIVPNEVPGLSPPIGGPIANVQLYILDAYLQPVPVGVPGELYIGGISLARGYLNRPELTTEQFITKPLKEVTHARLYKTGDLVRYLQDGRIEFIGRVDHQLKIRGFRIEPGEIETTLGKHPAVWKVVVLAHEGTPGNKHLVAYIVPREGHVPATTDLDRFLKEKLPDYMIPSHYVSLDNLPLTPNGKLDRGALPAFDPTRPELESAFVAPRTPNEEILTGLGAEVLGLERIGIHDNLFELGAHSLLVTQLISRVREVLKVELPLNSIFENPTVVDLAKIIENGHREASSLEFPAIQFMPRDGELPLSFSQERVWFIHQLNPSNIAYHFQATFRFKGLLDVTALEQSLNEIVRRHEIFRTTFQTINGRPNQVIHPPQVVELPRVDLQTLPEPEREAEARRLIDQEVQQPFDLAQLPLIRWTLVQLSEREFILVHVEHHIVHDGWSFNIFLQELRDLYEAFSTRKPSPLPELPIQFADFAYWQRQWMQGAVAETQLDYWQQKLAGDLPALQLPFDRPRPPVQRFRGAAPRIELPLELCESLRVVSRREGSTLFMTMLAAFVTLLYRYSGQDDLCVGSGIANRRWRETEQLIGMLVNNVVLRTDLSGNPTFRELLGRVRQVTLEAYMHQDVPFDAVVDKLQPERDLSRNPLFQVMFSFHDSPLLDLKLPGLALDLHEGLNNGSAKFDLNIVAIPRSEQRVGLSPKAGADGIDIIWEYNTDLFDDTTISRMIEHYQVLLHRIVADPGQRLAALPVLTEAERQQLLVTWNDTQTDYPRNACIQHLFEAQVEQTPHAIAVSFSGPINWLTTYKHRA
jgi:amino acid adenylation domain-containing protein